MYASMKDAMPNRGHLAIAELEQLGKLDRLITQNIDGLHFKAGHSPDFEEFNQTNRHYISRFYTYKCSLQNLENL